MKRITILFACFLALFALTACDENQQVIHILSAPSELDFLDVTAYADEILLAGGTSISPGLADSVFDYTVYVAKDANRFVINAGFNSEGTVTGVCVNDGETGLEFDFIGDADKTIQLTAQLKHMERADYRLTVVRGEANAVAREIEIWVEPRIGTFFVGSGVIPVIEVTANLPPQGGVLSYQWYVNDQNTSRGGSLLSGATGNTYTMQRGETLSVRTVYYYVEVTNTIGGRAAVTESPTCRVTFLNKYEMDYKSLAMVSMTAGVVDINELEVPNYPGSSYLEPKWGYTDDDNKNPFFPETWQTDGFLIAPYLVTWELWETVLRHADVANYRFSRMGNQGGAVWNERVNSTNQIGTPIGNRLHPVTNISWRDAVVWCNAYSEMDGLEPVYRDSNGEPLRDSRADVEYLIDTGKMTGNGYRLPTNAEWMYAARGGKPSTNINDPWRYDYPGTEGYDYVTGKYTDQFKYYIWSQSPGAALGGARQTGEVGSLRPNKIWNGSQYVDGLYDLDGMINQWIWYLDPGGGIGNGVFENQSALYSVTVGSSFAYALNPGSVYDFNDYRFMNIFETNAAFDNGGGGWYDNFSGFRVARNRGN